MSRILRQTVNSRALNPTTKYVRYCAMDMKWLSFPWLWLNCHIDVTDYLGLLAVKSARSQTSSTERVFLKAILGLCGNDICSLPFDYPQLNEKSGSQQTCRLHLEIGRIKRFLYVPSLATDCFYYLLSLLVIHLQPRLLPSNRLSLPLIIDIPFFLPRLLVEFFKKAVGSQAERQN